MNIESSTVNRANSAQTTTQTSQTKNSSANFSEELKGLEKESKTQETQETKKQESVKESDSKDSAKKEDESSENLDKAFDGLNSIVEELQKKDLNQSEEIKNNFVKDNKDSADNNNMINNDFNIQDNKDILHQMNPNMNFSGDGQPFSSFMNNDNQNSDNKLGSSAKDLAEESAILSTMAENIAIANKNNVLNNSEKTVTREEGVKKVDTKSGITIENVVKFDNIAMNEADVEVFTNLVQSGEVNLNEMAPKAAEKSVQVSKTLADMLAKSMDNNQPIRIDFDNNISVIIRVSRDGKISADFLPSSQVAEAYLKENLPLLRQKFEQNNIEYDELNQRERRDQNRDNRKKGREDE